MTKHRNRLNFVFALAAVVSLLVVTRANAIGGVTLSPALQEVVLEQDTESVEFAFSLKNNSDQGVEFQLTTLDFGSLDESGGVTFINESNDEFTTKYGLKQWVRLSTENIFLEAGETEQAKAFIDNKSSLSPGGHYGAIIATPKNQSGSIDETEVAINPSLAVLIFLKKKGGENFALSLDDPVLSNWNLPTSIKLRFTNSGNVHAVPRGTVTIRDPNGKEISRGIINQDSAAILPESIRVLPTTLREGSKSWVPGTYSATISWRYDGSDDIQETVVKFYYFGSILYLVFLIACIALICYVVFRATRRK